MLVKRTFLICTLVLASLLVFGCNDDDNNVDTNRAPQDNGEQVADSCTVETSDAVFVSNAALDQRVVFQNFSFFQPYSENAYNALADLAPSLSEWGMTDVWMAPPYRAYFEGPYFEGYAIVDRYDLGEFPRGPDGQKATKYGTSDELRQAIDALHGQNIQALADVVFNQMLGLDQRQIVPITAVDKFGQPTDSDIDGVLYAAYSKGGGPGQKKYGQIKQWSVKYENGTSPQYQGLYRVMVDDDETPYRYYGPDDSRNYLPDWLAGAPALDSGELNTVDDYFLVDGYYAVSGAGTDNPQYRPYLIYYQDPHDDALEQSYLDYMRDQGFAGDTDAQVRQSIIDGDSSEIGPATDAYIAAQPGYSRASEQEAYAFRFDTDHVDDIGTNIIEHEFLLGVDLDTTNPEVQAEELNWQRFLLDQYNFDGFRVDASSHINTDLLKQSARLMSDRYASDINNHLSLIETYDDGQICYENNNRNAQLIYDTGLYFGLLSALGEPKSDTPLREAVTASVIDRINGSAAVPPNWSFANNHDQENNLVKALPLTDSEAEGLDDGSFDYLTAQMEKYDADRRQVDKEYAPYNVPSSYALLLTNKDTVPAVFYGDLYEADKPYATAETPYYDDLTRLLEVRKNYATGDQKYIFYESNTASNAGDDLLASVRYGTSADTGVAVVVGNNPDTDTTIQVEMGDQHANQTFMNALDDGGQTLDTDADGMLSVPVQGVATPQVYGYLGVFVPAG